MAATSILSFASPLPASPHQRVFYDDDQVDFPDVSVDPEDAISDDICERLSDMNRPMLVFRSTSLRSSYMHVRSRFLASFHQSRVLSGRCQDLERRSGTLQSALQLPVLQRVKNMYEHYATTKALELLQLHYQIKQYHLIQHQNGGQQTQMSFIKELFLMLQHEEDLEDLDDNDMYDSDSELELEDIIDGDDDEEEYEL